MQKSQTQKILELLARLEAKMVTKDDLNDALKQYATKEDLKNFATKEDLKDFVRKDDIKDFVRKDDIKDFVRKDDIKDFVRKEDIKDFPTRGEMCEFFTRFPTREEMHLELERFVTIDYLDERLAALEDRLMTKIDGIAGHFQKIDETMIIFGGRLNDLEEDMSRVKQAVGIK